MQADPADDVSASTISLSSPSARKRAGAWHVRGIGSTSALSRGARLEPCSSHPCSPFVSRQATDEPHSLYPYFIRSTVQSESRFCRFLLHCGFLRRRVGLAVASPSSVALVRSVCTARDRRALRTRRPVHNLGPKSPITGWLSLCFLILCTRVQVTSHAGSARNQRPRPPGPRLRRLSAHRTTSARARLHKPSISSPPLSAAHHDVVGPRAVFADPCPPRVPSSSPPWPRSTTTSIWRLSGCATPSMGRWRGAKCRHVTQMCVL